MKLYEFFDRRSHEYLDIHVLDEAFINIFNYTPNEDMPDSGKIEQIELAGFVVSEMPEIDTLVHSGSDAPGVNKIQVTFNDKTEPIILDLYISEYSGKKYINIIFLNKDEQGKIWRRMYDMNGNEKTAEWCSNCNGCIANKK